MLRGFIDGDDDARRGGRKTGNKADKQRDRGNGTKETQRSPPNAPIYTRTVLVNRSGIETRYYG
jgi:hypothetical protein